MNAFIFVAVICAGQQCEFAVSNSPLNLTACQELKQEFLSVKFAPDITLAATQCIKIKEAV